MLNLRDGKFNQGTWAAQGPILKKELRNSGNELSK